MEAVAAWAAGREWAVYSFASLSAVACVLMILRSATAASTVDKARDSSSHADFAAFQTSYFRVYVLVMLADWLQGTHMYTLYSSYAESNSSISVGTLFFTGFMAAGVLGTFTGPYVDRYGRKRACLVYVTLELVINLLEHCNTMKLLLLGRVLGGISTSLLFSAFEAWMVTEHRRRGFPEAWLGRTFGTCAVWNGVSAIAAGFMAQVAADKLGDIGPFQLAIALTALAGVGIALWRENYGGAEEGAEGGTGEAGEGAGLLAAWKAVRSSSALLVLGSVYALFEGAMYIFVFNWVPSLASALGGFAAFAPVQGLLFSCLMAAISIGGELYTLAFRIFQVETIGFVIFAAACACMTVPIWCDGPAQFAAFLGFEICVGAFQPCIATHRSKYVPDAMQSTVNNLFRFPLNLLVAAGTMLSDYFALPLIFAICAFALAAAALAQLWLAAQQQQRTAPSKKAD